MIGAAALVVAMMAQTLAEGPSPAPLVVKPPVVQDTQSAWRPYFIVRVENDSLPGAGGDDSYTQGLEVRVVRRTPWPVLPRLVNAFWGDGANDDLENWSTLVVGQTMLTPHNIITYTPDPRDRRAAAFLYAGFESARFKYSEPDGDGAELLTVGLYGGMMGPVALGRDLQSGFHILRKNRMSKPWVVNQIGNQPQVNALMTRSTVVSRLATVSESPAGDTRETVYADLTARMEMSLGTTQTYVGYGGIVRLGRGFSGLPAGVIAYSAVRERSDHRIGAALIGGAKVRLIGRNAFITGVFGEPTGLRPERAVVDLTYGAEVLVVGWRISYLVSHRSAEFHPLPDELPTKHKYVALNVSREEDWPLPVRQGLAALARNTRVNLRFGRAANGTVDPVYPAHHRPALAASLGVEHSLFGGRFSLGLEQSGTTREAGPPAPGSQEHTDLFLIANALTLGWEPTSPTSRHKVQLRAGGGSGLAKFQRTPDTGALLEPEPVNVVERGRSLVAGVRYGFRLGRPLSLTADVMLARLTAAGQLVRRATFVTATFGVQIHPWGRDSGR